MLADELLQSSDDLTRMARSYVITGDIKYKRYFGEIYDIREGKQPRPLICYSDERKVANQELRRFLYKNVYYHPRVAEVNRQACEMLRNVFDAYVADPALLGDAAMRRIESEGLHRTICDYIAGMTDRYLMEEHARLEARSRTR